MNKKQFFLGVILAALIGGLVALAGASYLSQPQSATNFTEKQNTSFVNWLADEKFTIPDGPNFVAAAQQVTPSVVHFTSRITIQGSRGMGSLEEFFGFR